MTEFSDSVKLYLLFLSSLSVTPAALHSRAKTAGVYDVCSKAALFILDTRRFSAASLRRGYDEKRNEI